MRTKLARQVRKEVVREIDHLSYQKVMFWEEYDAVKEKVLLKIMTPSVTPEWEISARIRELLGETEVL